MKNCIAAAVVLLLVICGSARAADALESRAADVQKLFRKDPGGFEKLFHKDFRAAVPDAKLRPILAGMFKSFGKCTATRLVERTDANSGKFDFTFEKGDVAPVTLSIDPAEPHLINGLWIGPAARPTSSFGQIIDQVKSLPGEASFLAVQLDAEPHKKLAAHNEDKRLAIGSTFKLYILAELVRAIEAGERKWTDIVSLDESSKSLPGGELQNWPTGSQLTLNTLACLMISKSDNTAADQLLRTLGREKVEAMMKTAGHGEPERNIPFFSTLEMFKVKYVPAMADKFLAGSARDKRALLDGAIARISKDKIAPSISPRLIDKLEWFASSSDLAAVMNWLRQHSEKEPAAQARGVLAINPGLAPSKTHFPFVGYKGGSEPGVLNLTFLLKSKTGHWYALTATWNNPKAALEEDKLFALLQQSFELLD